MQASSKPAAEIVREFVRGDRPWQDLRLVGMAVSFMDDGCDCEGGGDLMVTPSIADVAHGFMAQVGRREVDLRRWASVMLAASAVIDLSALEEHGQGELVLNALWDASAGYSTPDPVLADLRQLAADAS